MRRLREIESSLVHKVNGYSSLVYGFRLLVGEAKRKQRGEKQETDSANLVKFGRESVVLLPNKTVPELGTGTGQ